MISTRELMLLAAFTSSIAIYYYLFVIKHMSMKMFSNIMGICFLIVFMFSKKIFGIPSLEIIAIFVSVGLPALGIVAILKAITYFLKRKSFNRLVDKCIMYSRPSDIIKLCSLLLGAIRKMDLDRQERKRLLNAYNTIKMNREISYDTRYLFGKSLIVLGIIDARDIPPKHNEGINNNLGEDEYIKIAKNALNEAKGTVKSFPNACIISCRKYAENVTRYMVVYYGIYEEGDTFAEQLGALEQSNCIEDRDKIGVLYRIKKLGNEAAHREAFDADTAKSILDETIMLDTWFRSAFAEAYA